MRRGASVILLSDLLTRHRDSSRKEFVEAYSHPWLLTYSLPPSLLGGKSSTAGDLPKEAKGPPVLLEVMKRPGRNLFEDRVTLGRSSNSDILVFLRKVSNSHAHFRRVGDQWRIFNDNSQTPIEVDGVQVSGEDGCALQPGSTISLAKDATFEFLGSGSLYERLRSSPE